MDAYSSNTINNQGRWIFGYPGTNYIYGTALFTKQEKQATIGNNRIERYRYGIEYYRLPVGTSEPLTRIKENRILDGTHGLVASYIANPLLTTSSINRIYSAEIPVQITCNLFDNDSLNILGLGNVRDTVFGFSLGGVNYKSAGNKFSSTNYWGCSWEEINAKIFPPVYKFNIGSGYPEAPRSGTQPSLNYDGIPGSFSIDGVNSFINNCVSVVNRGRILIADTVNTSWQIVFYPNPFNSEINCLSNYEIDELLIYNSKGELIKSEFELVVIKTIEWPSGVYIVRVKSKNQEFRTYKLIKIDN
jgi:hypothetical protein